MLFRAAQNSCDPHEKVKVNVHNFPPSQYDEPLDSESRKVEHITLHPDFRYMLTQPDRFDMALLKLDEPVHYRGNILPICLPTADYPLEGKVGVVAGWGKTDNSFGKTGTNLLNKVRTRKFLFYFTYFGKNEGLKVSFWKKIFTLSRFSNRLGKIKDFFPAA